MNTQTLTTISVIVGIFVGLAGVFLLARQSAQASADRQSKAIEKAVSDATAPLDRALAEANRVIDRKSARIDSLEDELRRGRGRERDGQD